MKHRLKKLGTRSAALVLGATMILPGLSVHAASANYTAKDTDTFWKLSRQFDVPLQQLMAANSNVDPLNIYAGLKLNIPGQVQAMSASPKIMLTSTTKQATAAQSITTKSGQSLSFSKVLDIKATAYSASAEENGKWGPVDYFGNPLKLGTIAVDPNVIPFGTKVYITGYDFAGLPTGGLIATATDNGGAIKGNRIDIFVPGTRQFVSAFGYQNVKVYILK